MKWQQKIDQIALLSFSSRILIQALEQVSLESRLQIRKFYLQSYVPEFSKAGRNHL